MAGNSNAIPMAASAGSCCASHAVREEMINDNNLSLKSWDVVGSGSLTLLNIDMRMKISY